MPPLLGAAADANNSTAKAMGVPLAFFIAAWSYALCVNFVPSYRDPADKFTTTEIGLQTGGVKDEENLSGEEREMKEVGEKGGMEMKEDGQAHQIESKEIGV